MPLRPRTSAALGLALAYSVLLFFIANYLPLITNGLAELLTWAVYAEIVRGLVIFIATALAFIAFVRFPRIPNRALFIAQLAPFAAISAYFIARLEDSVNEYVHYPQYAVLALLWYVALEHLEPDLTPPRGWFSRTLKRRGPLAMAVAISLLLGFCEEGWQYFAPRRSFDIQDLLLNGMGVWLGAIVVWTVRDEI